MIGRALLRMILPAFWLAGVVACYPPPPAPEPEAVVQPTGVIDTVRPGTNLRLLTGGRKFSGTLVGVTADSLRLRPALQQTAGDTTLARADLDSIWVRKSGGHTGTKAGIAVGLLVAAALVLAPPASDGSSYGPALALRVGLIALGVGILSDVVSPADWTPIGSHYTPP